MSMLFADLDEVKEKAFNRGWLKGFFTALSLIGLPILIMVIYLIWR
jgi:hypothetical protein